MTKRTAYVTFIVHCPHCHQRLSAQPSEGETTLYVHENASDCPEGSDIELPTVTVDQMLTAFGAKKKRTSKAKTK